MPKVAKELSAIQVRRLTKPGLHAVGGVSGLHLLVRSAGARFWILRIKMGQRRPDIGLGGFPEVTLEQARLRARETKDMVWRGIDPIADRKAARDALLAAQGREITFAEAAAQAHAAKAPEFRNAKHAAQWIRTLEQYAFPVLGEMPVAMIEPAHVLKVLQPIWQDRTETATRVRLRIKAVMSWAEAGGYREKDQNPARWQDSLEHLLPAAKKIHKAKHHARIPWQEVTAFLAKLREKDGLAAQALEFAILTAARSGEVRHATWSDIDLDAKLWTIPAERMKAGLKHEVPLSDAAVRLLKAQPKLKGCDLIFPGMKQQPLSDNTLSKLMRDMKVDAVPHGFRSSFKDFCRNRTTWPDEVSELALAHVNSDETRAAYARDGLLPQRTKLMQQWAQFLAEVPTGEKVIAMKPTRTTSR